MKPAVSIVIAYYNDSETTVGTIESLYDTIDIENFEVILVDDGSKDKVPKEYDKPKLRKFSHFMNIGVGHAFDTGVSIAKSDNIILMGSDIRFENNGWCRRMLSVLDRRPESLVSVVCGSHEGDVDRFGADIIFYIDNTHLSEGHPMKSIKDYRSILEGRWRPRTGRGIYSIPCLMGAFYGVSRAWYNKISGFDLHYQWGNLEPYISLKSWRLGGDVVIDTENKVNHMFGRGPRREAKYDVIKYNQLMIAGTVFGSFGKKYAYHLEGQQGTAFTNACNTYNEKMDAMMHMARYCNAHAKLTPQELEDKMVELSYCYNQPDCVYEKPI